MKRIIISYRRNKEFPLDAMIGSIIGGLAVLVNVALILIFLYKCYNVKVIIITHIFALRKWYDSNALKYKASYLLRHLVLGLLVLRHLLA